jgi:hypothetical protein
MLAKKRHKLLLSPVRQLRRRKRAIAARLSSEEYFVKWIFEILRGFARFFRRLLLVPEDLSQPRNLLLKPLDAVNFMVNHCTEASEGALVHSAMLHLPAPGPSEARNSKRESRDPGQSLSVSVVERELSELTDGNADTLTSVGALSRGC